jgi:VanZ family protein
MFRKQELELEESATPQTDTGHRFLNKSTYKRLFFGFIAFLLLSPVLPEIHLPGPLHILTHDKFQHVAAFFILSLLLNRASDTFERRSRNIVALFIFGILVEVAQSFMPNRGADIYDALADLAGIVLFQALLSLYLYRKKYKYNLKY